MPNEIAFDAMGGEGALYDADAERLGLVVEYEHPIMGTLRQFGELVNFSDTPARVFGPPPRVGEHTLEILEWLGSRRRRREAGGRGCRVLARRALSLVLVEGMR